MTLLFSIELVSVAGAGQVSRSNLKIGRNTRNQKSSIEGHVKTIEGHVAFETMNQSEEGLNLTNN